MCNQHLIADTNWVMYSVMELLIEEKKLQLHSIIYVIMD